MKKLLADFLGINENDIVSYLLNTEHDLSIEKERDFGNTYDIITGDIFSPKYYITTRLDKVRQIVELEDLLVFIYTKKQ